MAKKKPKKPARKRPAKAKKKKAALKKPAGKKPIKEMPKGKTEAVPEKPGKINVTTSLKRSWFGARSAWMKSMYAFGNYLAILDDKKARELMEFSKTALFKNTYKEIVVEHPELRQLVMSDYDRGCMLDIYSNLSVRFHEYIETEKLGRMERLRLERMGYNV